MKFFGTKEIKTIVNRWIQETANDLKGRVVVDAPAGNGVTSEALKAVGAKVQAYDLFPEFFRVPDLKCVQADLSQGLPVPDGSVDVFVCQEGIEHLSDQLKMFEEFNRVLKHGGRLMLTTPNASNLKARWSHLMGETESFSKLMPPNEIDSLWFAPDNAIYFGHVFLVGLFKLRFFGKMTGLRLAKIHSTRANATALLLFPFIYPLIVWSNFRARQRFVKKHGFGHKDLADEIFSYAISPTTLLENHLFLEFHKVETVVEARASLRKEVQVKTFQT
ncbi:MAG: class I SAM-dependent methyltransferase [Bdellovibrionales bacterium]|nr:class I SAM-dependent methyltransferase [Bdellovibrionales bacterium]